MKASEGNSAIEAVWPLTIDGVAVGDAIAIEGPTRTESTPTVATAAARNLRIALPLLSDLILDDTMPGQEGNGR
jgi:hypothetical protein